MTFFNSLLGALVTDPLGGVDGRQPQAGGEEK